MGDKNVDIEKFNIHIDGDTFEVTPRLWEKFPAFDAMSSLSGTCQI